MDVDNNPIFTNTHIYYTHQQLTHIISDLRQRVLNSLQQQQESKKAEVQAEGEMFLENSLLKLEERLKKHYPLKGQIETEIVQQRSGVVVQHKRRYERFIRAGLDKLDA